MPFFYLCVIISREIESVDMKKNKIVLKHCPNFYKIINFEFLEEDSISAKLIGIYENFIFDVDVESQSDIKTVEKLDFVINKYNNFFHYITSLI